MGDIRNSSSLDNKLKFGFVLNTGLTILEFIAGFLSGSLALISDASHNLTDSLTLLISLSANKIAKREANAEKTYGYGRATIFAAFINSAILVVLSFYIFYEAYQRILNPKPVEGGLVALVAFIGIIVNGTIALLFIKDKDDLNVRSNYINMFFDTLSSVGALAAGVLILATSKTIFDPIIGIVIGIMLLISGAGVLKDASHILFEGVPEGIKFDEIKSIILTSPKVKNVDDLHIWAISSRYAALSCHIVIEDCDVEESVKIINQIKQELREKSKIQHSTIETELIECTPD